MYKLAKRSKKALRTCGIISGSSLFVGTAVIAADSDNENDTFPDGHLAIASLLYTVCLGTGIACLFNLDNLTSRKAKAVNIYNGEDIGYKAPNIYLEIGQTANGLGITLNF